RVRAARAHAGPGADPGDRRQVQRRHPGASAWMARRGAAILTEWCAQIGRLRALGVTLSHFDSHHDVHTIADLFPVLKTLQNRYGVRKVRLTRNLEDA